MQTGLCAGAPFNPCKWCIFPFLFSVSTLSTVSFRRAGLRFVSCCICRVQARAWYTLYVQQVSTERSLQQRFCTFAHAHVQECSQGLYLCDKSLFWDIFNLKKNGYFTLQFHKWHRRTPWLLQHLAFSGFQIPASLRGAKLSPYNFNLLLQGQNTY